MHLLETSALRLFEFEGENIPKYAILSHRWQRDEVCFRGLKDGSGRKLEGWKKIRACCQLAASEGFKYVWIDACCIDKRSSQQLSEAINSMFQWYQRAKVCYVYLADVPPASKRKQPGEATRRLIRSRWWTRGWTLQELIAPKDLVFYDQDWGRLGTRDEFSSAIESHLGITADDFVHFRRRSVAKRMSWAATRETTRPEDKAYCLLGLFDVNMPLLYGEGGERAFQRLQREIIRDSEDESIFAWHREGGPSGLLATAPADFRDSGRVFRLEHFPRRPWALTNKGLNIRFQGAAVSCFGATIRNVPLNCSTDGRPLVLHLVQSTRARDRFCRIGPLEPLRASSMSQLAEQPQNCVDIFVRQQGLESTPYEYPILQWSDSLARACSGSDDDAAVEGDAIQPPGKRRRTGSTDTTSRPGSFVRAVSSFSMFWTSKLGSEGSPPTGFGSALEKRNTT